MGRVRMSVPLLKLAAYLLVVPTAAFAGLALDVWTYGGNMGPAEADVAVVLGAAVWTDRPSPVFAERINHAIQLYNEGKIQHIIFTGGVGQPGEAAESEVARDYAVARGVPEKNISCDTASTITWENLVEAKKLLQQRDAGPILIVSDPLHMRRAMLMAHDVGMDNASPSPTPTTRYTGAASQLRFLIRETYYYALYLLQRPFR